jgi:outer membrane biosynthesis protein TonB
MRVPQVSERVKEAPAQALRAMFAGIGQLLSASDKIRGKSATDQAPAEAKTATPETATPETATPETATPETATPETATPETATPETATPETATPETATPETATPETATPETATPETATPETATPETDAAPAAPAASTGELPLPNYDDLTIASLRARLRNLSADQLAQLIDYEKSHANRADVIQMFERRIAKLAEG